MGVRAALQAGQFWCQAVTTNVPGPRIPLYVLGKRMVSAHAYVPIAGGTRCSIGIFSYLNTMTFGINADFDGYPDVDVLASGIRRGLDQLLKIAGAEGVAEQVAQAPPKSPAPPKAAKKTAAKRAPAKKTAAAGR
jgi:diacylglycerol O-acyltransferase